MTMPAGGDAFDESELSHSDQADLDAANPAAIAEAITARNAKAAARDELVNRVLAAMVVYPAERALWMRENVCAADRIYVHKLLEVIDAALTTDDRPQLLTALRALAADATGHAGTADPGERP